MIYKVSNKHTILAVSMCRKPVASSIRTHCKEY